MSRTLSRNGTILIFDSMSPVFAQYQTTKKAYQSAVMRCCMFKYYSIVIKTHSSDSLIFTLYGGKCFFLVIHWDRQSILIWLEFVINACSLQLFMGGLSCWCIIIITKLCREFIHLGKNLVKNQVTKMISVFIVKGEVQRYSSAW